MAARFDIDTPKSIVKSLKKIQLPWRERILDAMSELAQNPYLSEKMSGKLRGKRKIRVWPYRIIYKVDIRRRRIIVTDVGHRGSIGYK
jgi:mRNA interferase RelE/StbE